MVVKRQTVSTLTLVCILVWLSNNNFAESSPRKVDYYRAFTRLKRPMKTLINDVKKAMIKIHSTHGVLINDKSKNKRVISTCIQKFRGGSPNTEVGKLQFHLTTAIDIFQYFYGILQKIQIEEFSLERAKGRKAVLIKVFRNLEFKLRDFVEGDLREAANYLLMEESKDLISPYSVGRSGLKLSQKTNSTYAKFMTSKNRHVSHIHKLHTIFVCLNQYYRQNVLKETE